LASEQDALADSAFTRLAETVATADVTVKAMTYRDMVIAYVTAPHPAIAYAQRYADLLDALGPSAAVERMLAHRAIADEAQRRDSIPLQEHEIAAALRASREIRGAARHEYARVAFGMSVAAADLKVRQHDGPGALATLRAGRDLWASVRPVVNHDYSDAIPWYASVGTSAPAIRATRWFHRSAADTLRPTPGQVGLIVFVRRGCMSYCFPGYAVLRRIADASERHRMNITLIARTNGWYPVRGVTPDSEMVLTSTYFMTHLHLPGSLAMWQTSFGTRDDGHQTIQSAPNEDAYHPPQDELITYVIDHRGVIRLVTTLSSQHEAMLRHTMDELFSGAR
jgi:hypothetical protein